jgi:peptidoglycan/xylan/chitin deacetylase (PgdA/CDA1 family)
MNRYAGGTPRPGWRGRLLREVVARVAPPGLLVVRGAGRRREIALTFDDGPEPLLDGYLDVLERFSARATFFLLGECIALRRAGMLEIVKRGHELGNHGYSHAHFPTLARAALDDEIGRTQAMLPPAERRRPLLRPPQGRLSPAALARAVYLGYTTVLWSVDSHDCRTERAADVIEALDPARLRPGDIVLLHEGQAWTLEALPEVLARLRGAGYELVTVGDLLR